LRQQQGRNENLLSIFLSDHPSFHGPACASLSLILFKMGIMRIAITFFVSFLLVAVVNGQLRLPSVIASGMVLQQKDSVTIWGWGYSGQEVRVTSGWDNKTSVGRVANTAKWSLKLKTPPAGGPYTIRFSSLGSEITLDDIMIGEVWLCSGQSNMEWSYWNDAGYIKQELPTAYNKNIRFFNVPRNTSDFPQQDIKAFWQVCDSNSLKSFSAVGYYFGRKLHENLNVPIGLINASWGGTAAEVWTPEEVINNDPVLKEAAGRLQVFDWWSSKPGHNYNGMLSPLVPFSIAGAIWYQGESNTGTNSTYAQLQKAMIESWRKKWDKDFPFYYVQIAPYKYSNHNVGALLMEQQTKVLEYPNTGMVVITDLIDSVTNIHPSNKRDVGVRLANWALAETYKKNIGAYKSPILEKVIFEHGQAILSIQNAGSGLMAKTGKENTITGFYITDAKGEWLPALVKIEKDRIIAWNKKIKQPTAIRYAFGNTIIGNVFSKEGLPLTPFRSDNFPVDQGPVN
jgi:sialate O-acetylesterase